MVNLKIMPICGKKEILPCLESLWSYFEVSCLRSPNSLAIVDIESGEKLSFSHFYSRVNKLSRYLLRHLSDEDDSSVEKSPIALCIAPSSHLVVCIFAILQIKRAYVPLDINFPTSRVDYIIKDSKPKILLTAGHPPALSKIRDKDNDAVVIVDVDESKNEIETEDGSLIDEKTVPSSSKLIAAILYTSGSTGTPKGVRIPHSAVRNRLIWQWRNFPYDEAEVCCFKTTLTFVDSISEIFGPLLTSHSLIIIPKRITTHTETLVKVLEDHRIGRLVLVPSLLRSILIYASRTKNPLPSLRLWICSGEPLQADLVYSFFETFTNNQVICNFYGSTEVMGDVSFVEFSSSEEFVKVLHNNKVPIGFPLSNTRIYLLDQNLEEVVEGFAGEMFVAGKNLAEGYVGLHNSEKFIQNTFLSQHDEEGYETLYRTGDFARFVKNNLIFEGRTDSQVKVRGHRVDLSEIEVTFQRLREVEKCCVICYHPGETDQTIIAFFSSVDERIVAKDVRKKIVSLLPVYMHPQVIKVDDMPFLVNGKIDRQKLLQNFEEIVSEKYSGEREFDLSGCEEEKLEIAKTFMQTLVKILGPCAPFSISLDQNFFDLGGNSLNALLVITSFQDAGYHVGISEFLDAKTLKEILDASTKIERNIFENENIFSTKNYFIKNYKYFPLKLEHKEIVREIITKSFVLKGDLEKLLNITENEFNVFTDQVLDSGVNSGLSFILCRENDVNEIVSVSINADYFEEPSLSMLPKNMQYIVDFLEDCETKVRCCLPEGTGKIFHSVLMATKNLISPAENVRLIQLMEIENHRLALENGFQAIFTTNTSRLTQYVCEDLMSYKSLASYQLNEWEAQDGSRPFKIASDDKIAVTSVLYLDNGKSKFEI